MKQLNRFIEKLPIPEGAHALPSDDGTVRLLTAYTDAHPVSMTALEISAIVFGKISI